MKSATLTENPYADLALTPEFFASRRQELMRRLGKGGVAVIRSAPEHIRSNDTHYRYRQDSDFYYLTGFHEPDAVCLLIPDHPEHQYVLFVRPRNPERETWDGRRVGPEAAKERFGADATYSIEQLDEQLRKYLEKTEIIHFRFGRDEDFDKRIFNLLKYYRYWRQRNGVGPHAIVDLSETLHEMRLYKSSQEIDLMRHAAAIAASAHKEAMAAVHPAMSEYEVEAIIENRFRREGASGPAYNSIVGGGINATILHYVENSSKLEDGDLLLVDAGAEYQFYCSDITRTYPINGKFTPAQATIYEIVLEAQIAAINLVSPGTQFDEIHQKAVEVLVDGLLKVGLLTESREKVLEEHLYRKFYMHRTSHWLGLDVHDTGKYVVDGESRKLEPGMVLTIEPGLYIGESEEIPQAYRRIGIRIEDDILVTETGFEVLTSEVPKKIEELEAIVGKG